MLSRLRLAACLVSFALLGAACSSNTLVSREDRASESDSAESETVDASDDAATAETFADSSSETPDEESATDSRGDRNNDDDDDESDDTPQTPRELEEAGGFGLGGAEQLGALATDCRDGNDLACDVLFPISGFGSAEENLAVTCGGRSEVEVLFCTPGITAEADLPSFDITSEGLGDIVTLCEVEGDMTACDFLYFRSPVDSTFEEIGGTCGGRVDVAVPDCRTFLSE